MTVDLGWVLLGLAILTGGAELLIGGAAALAERLGISRVVVGLTVVAFGTSAPELTVSLLASWRGEADLALGNVVGSNVYNVFLILGASALLTPLAVSLPLLRVDIPLMIAASLLTGWLSRDGLVGRADGALLLLLMLAYLVRILRAEGGPPVEVPEGGGPVREGLRVLVGLLFLVAGTRLFVDGAVGLARAFEVSELVIGLTIVAAGTSLPETATSVLAAWRGERDLAVGNIVGSNLFNLLMVLGAAAVVSPAGVAVAPAALAFDLPVMVVAAAVCLPAAFTDGGIDRREGGLLLLAYLGYVAYLIGRARGSPALPGVGAALALFLVPFGALVLLDLLGGRQAAAAEGTTQEPGKDPPHA